MTVFVSTAQVNLTVVQNALSSGFVGYDVGVGVGPQVGVGRAVGSGVGSLVGPAIVGIEDIVGANDNTVGGLVVGTGEGSGEGFQDGWLVGFSSSQKSGSSVQS